MYNIEDNRGKNEYIADKIFNLYNHNKNPRKLINQLSRKELEIVMDNFCKYIWFVKYPNYDDIDLD